MQKTRRAGEICKQDYPIDKICIKEPVLVYQGVAKKLKLRINGRRNPYGGFIGRRSCRWQSDTLRSFAVICRANTHTLPNMRLPPAPEIHSDTLCHNPKCSARCADN